MLFSAVPLLDVRRVKPSLLLRESGRAGGRDWVGWAALAGLLAALVAIASWQAGSIRIGLAVSAGLAAVALVLCLVGAASSGRSARWRSSRSVALRHAVLRLTRPGNQTRAVLLSVGLGAFFIVGVRSLQANLLDQFSVTLDGERRRHVPHRRAAGAGGRGRSSADDPHGDGAAARHSRCFARG